MVSAWSANKKYMKISHFFFGYFSSSWSSMKKKKSKMVGNLYKDAIVRYVLSHTFFGMVLFDVLKKIVPSVHESILRSSFNISHH